MVRSKRRRTTPPIRRACLSPRSQVRRSNLETGYGCVIPTALNLANIYFLKEVFQNKRFRSLPHGPITSRATLVIWAQPHSDPGSSCTYKGGHALQEFVK